MVSMAQHHRDHYDVLGVKRSATQDDIKRAYRKLARELHPDVSKVPDAEKRFNEVTEAYEVLSDPERRRVYDQFGHAGVAGGDPFARGRASGSGGARQAHYTWSNIGGRPGPGGNVGAEDVGAIFEEIFGASMHDSPFAAPPRGTPRQRAKPREFTHEVTVTFMTAVNGGTEQVRFSSSGETKTIDVAIPAGVADGQKLRVRQAAGAADMIITVSVGKHPYFYREDKPLDLLIDVPITIAEAALGASVTVPLLKGSVELTIPPGTSSGTRLRIKGHGIKPKRGDPGDLFAIVKIVPPEALDEKTKSLLEQLAGALKSPRTGAPWKNP